MNHFTPEQLTFLAFAVATALASLGIVILAVAKIGYAAGKCDDKATVWRSAFTQGVCAGRRVERGEETHSIQGPFIVITRDAVPPSVDVGGHSDDPPTAAGIARPSISEVTR